MSEQSVQAMAEAMKAFITNSDKGGDVQIRNLVMLKAALSLITFKNTVLDFKWEFEVEETNIRGRTAWLVRVSFERPDTITGEIGRGRGRDEIVYEGTTVSGAVKTAWLLVELMVRHELMEGFRWCDKRIFNPHNSVIDLARVQVAHDKK